MPNKSLHRPKKSLRSKIGYTLVELVVTITILSLFAGVGVGIFAMAMRNYLTASVTSQEQSKALQVEEYLVSNAKVAKSLCFIRPKATAAEVLPSYEFETESAAQTGQAVGTKCSYLVIDGGSSVAKTYDTEKTKSGATATLTSQNTLSYDGIKQIIISYKKHVNTKGDPGTGKGTFVFMEYDIMMNDGYSLSGSVVMNNCTDTTNFTIGTEYVLDGIDREIGDNAKATGIIFVK